MPSEPFDASPARGPTSQALIRRGALQHGPRTAVVFGGASLTFTEVDQLSSQLAHALHAAGAVPHTRVALLVNNSLLSIPMDFACVKASINRVPLNTQLPLDEHLRMLTHAKCTHLLFGANLAEHAAALRAASPGLVCMGMGADLEDAPDLLLQAESCPTDAPAFVGAHDDVLLTLFTAGTTGTLKAAQHTQASCAAICRNVMLNLLSVASDDAMLHVGPLTHATGIFVMPLWLRGGRAVILPGFEPGLFLRTLQAERITAISLLPVMLQMLFDHPDIATTDVEALRYVIYGGAPMPRALILRAMALWGQHRFWQSYGQTEAPLSLAVLRPEDHVDELLDTCGQPALDIELRMIDEFGNDVPPGSPGQIAVRAPSAVSGYYNAAVLNAGTFLDCGWVRTQDIGVLDERGFLQLKDRSADMIVSGGYNVYPSEVENALMTHPQVAECAVIGLPQAKWVELVTAFVVLRAGEQASEAELIAHVGEQLAAYKKPQRVHFVDQLPRTVGGKLDHKQLRDRYRGQEISTF